MTSATSTMRDAALEYARHGDPVFPCWWIEDGRCACGTRACSSPGKHPIGKCAPVGLIDATTDEATIGRWWTQFPRANIATRTGITRTVFDVDHAKGGPQALARLEAHHGPLPVTAKVLTGGGGGHYHFLLVPGLRNSASKVGPGLDIRGEDGYVLLPPSTHISGRTYRDDPLAPMYEAALAPMPAWLVAQARETTADEGNGGRATADEWAQRLTGAPEGQRRAVALEIAGHYLGLRIAPEEVEAILVGYAARCQPPFPEREVRALVRDLARRDRAKERGSSSAEVPITPDDDLALVSIGDLLSEPDRGPDWLVEPRLPAGGLGLLAGKPKAGKSTLARCLALRVVRGEPWLGFVTTPGAVLYLALEEKRQEVRAHFRALGARPGDAIYILCTTAPADALARLRREADRRRPVLIIIDPLFRLVRIPSERGNDYATMTAALEPLLQLARETGAHVLAVHHLGKGERADGDAILGSTAIFAAVDTALLLKRSERYRTLSSLQRYGPDLEEMTLTLDPVTRDVVAGPPRAEAEATEAARLILEAIESAAAPVTEAELDGMIECRRQVWKKALRDLVGTGKVDRTGRGGKTDPFRYSGSLKYVGTREPKDLFPAQPPVLQSKDSGSRVPYGVLVPEVPRQ